MSELSLMFYMHYLKKPSPPKKNLTAQKMKLPLKISSVNVIRKLWIWSHLLKKSFMENFIFCAISLHQKDVDRTLRNIEVEELCNIS